MKQKRGVEDYIFVANPKIQKDSFYCLLFPFFQI